MLSHGWLDTLSRVRLGFAFAKPYSFDRRDTRCAFPSPPPPCTLRPMRPSPRDIPLPRAWNAHVRAGFLNAISLAHLAITAVRGWCVGYGECLPGAMLSHGRLATRWRGGLGFGSAKALRDFGSDTLVKGSC